MLIRKTAAGCGRFLSRREDVFKFRRLRIANSWWAALIAFVIAFPCEAAQSPDLPRVFIETTYAPLNGAILMVNAGGSVQAALNKARPGDTIVLEAGARFAGPFILPRKSGNGWIHVRSSALDRLPPAERRVTATDVVHMPKVTVRSGQGGAIQTAGGAHHFRFIGIEIAPADGNFVYNLVDIGQGDRSVADLPHDIIFDRCYIRGDSRVGGRRGVAMNGIRVAVVDSHVSGFKEPTADTQALWTYNTPGPLKIVNNYLEAAGENFMSGGADSRLVDTVPSDIEIRRNHFAKPLAWMNERWAVKNLLELKTGRRVLIEGNVFENSWPSAQSGYAILFTPRNQDGKAPWSVVEDVTFRLNKVVNVGQGIALSGRDENPSGVTKRVLIEHNVFDISRLRGADGRGLLVTGGPVDVTFRHNTVMIAEGGGTTAFIESNPKAERFVFVDNLLSNGNYGFAGTGTGPGTPTLERHFGDFTFRNNAFIGGGGKYPPGNLFLAGVPAVRFVDFKAGNYRLASGGPLRRAGSDGRDIGADIDEVERAIAGVVFPGR